MTDILLAEFAIRQLHARYADAVWRQDHAAFRACFTPDAEWRIAGRHARGIAQIADTFASLIAPAERVLMQVSLPCLALEGAAARGRVAVTELIRRRDGSGLRTIGIYEDAYAGEGGNWRFSARHWQLAYRGAPDLSDPMEPLPDAGPPPGG